MNDITELLKWSLSAGFFRWFGFAVLLWIICGGIFGFINLLVTRIALLTKR